MGMYFHAYIAIERDKHMLLALDNCEHLIEAAAACCRGTSVPGHSVFRSAPQAFSANSRCVIPMCRSSSTFAVSLIPLAIELAAASIDALGLQGVASRLDHPLRMPTIRRRSAAPRHHTLRSPLDWSYRLLTEEEQWALRRLSVFASSFTMDGCYSSHH